MNGKCAVGLYSGGLDSILAIRIIRNQGFKVIAVHFKTPFTIELYKDRKNDTPFQNDSGIILKRIFLGREYIGLLKNPRYGYGKHFNPCIDCHLMMVRKAKNIMENYGAGFVFSGEVIGERPMSQRKDALRIIERDSGLEGRLVRPLSAQLLPESIPEREGVLDRTKLFAIQGRSRKTQLRMAEQWGITDFETPGGGCSLTERNVAGRVKESLEHGEDTLFDMLMIKMGRHFRTAEGDKIVAGRDEKENEKLLKFTANKGMKLTVKDFSSTYVYVRNTENSTALEKAARICARYSVARKKKIAEVYYWKKDFKDRKVIRVKPFSVEEVERQLV